MGVADELEALSKLHASGDLTDEEYAEAKERVLSSASAVSADPGVVNSLFGGDQNSLGNAANRYVSYQIVMGVIGLIVFLLFAAVILSNFNRPPGF